MSAFHEKSYKLVSIWFILQFCQLVYVVSSWASVRDRAFFDYCNENASDEGESPFRFWLEHQRVQGFGLFLMLLMSVLVTWVGALVLRYRRTRTSLGFFIGLSFVMGWWCLILAVEAGDILYEKKYTQENEFSRAYVESRALFAVLQCVLYFVLMGLLLTWQEDLVKLSLAERKALEELDSNDDDEVCTKNVQRANEGGSTSSSSTTGQSVVQS